MTIAYSELFLSSLVVRRPPRSTLFPTRRSSDLDASGADAEGRIAWVTATGDPARPVAVAGAEQYRRLFYSRDFIRRIRSEEHTSELQSHSDLVCRLLLEKKKHTDRDLSNDLRHR